MKRCVVLCCSLIAHTSPSAICLPDRRSFLLHPPCPPSIPPPSPPSRLPSDSSSRRTSTTPRSLRSSRRMSSFRCDSQTQSRRREAEATASRPLDATCSAARPVAGKRTGAGQVSWRTQLTTALRLAFLLSVCVCADQERQLRRRVQPRAAQTLRSRARHDQTGQRRGMRRQRSCGAADGCDSQPRLWHSVI